MPGRGGHGKGGLPSLAIQVIHPIQLIQAYSDHSAYTLRL